MFKNENNWKTVQCFALFHVFIIALSNYAVQFPIDLGPLPATWGAFTFPFIFLATDLTVRLYGSSTARRIIGVSMIPALFVSYIMSMWFQEGTFQGFSNALVFDSFVFRIVLASASAYVIGQLLDVLVFQKLRESKKWYVAPLASNYVGGAFDTFIFFFVAFYMTSDPYMAQNWFNIGLVDYGVKVLVGMVVFLPLYGAILSFITTKIKGTK